jgi:hypothetical protein
LLPGEPPASWTSSHLQNVLCRPAGVDRRCPLQVFRAQCTCPELHPRSHAKSACSSSSLTWTARSSPCSSLRPCSPSSLHRPTRSSPARPRRSPTATASPVAKVPCKLSLPRLSSLSTSTDFRLPAFAPRTASLSASRQPKAKSPPRLRPSSKEASSFQWLKPCVPVL